MFEDAEDEVGFASPHLDDVLHLIYSKAEVFVQMPPQVHNGELGTALK